MGQHMVGASIYFQIFYLKHCTQTLVWSPKCNKICVIVVLVGDGQRRLVT
jgi:hypothetical protein